MLEKMDSFFQNRLDGYDEHMLTEIDGAAEFYQFTATQLPAEMACRVLDLRYCLKPLRRLNSKGCMVPSGTALLKALYLARYVTTKKWTVPLKNWDKMYGDWLARHKFSHCSFSAVLRRDAKIPAFTQQKSP